MRARPSLLALTLAAPLGAQDLFDDPLRPLPPFPEFVFAAEMDGDGELDLVTVGSGADPTQVVSIQLGLGGGAYAEPVSTFGSDDTIDACLGDADADGFLDVLRTHDGDIAEVELFRSSTPGQLSFPSTHWTWDFPHSVALADFNQDGKVDLVTGNVVHSTYSVLPGQGNGNFGGPIKIGAGMKAHDLDVGDVDGDGDPDVVAVGSLGAIGLLRNEGGGAFTALTSGAPSARQVVLSDLDGDGVPEAVCAGSTSSGFHLASWNGTDFDVTIVDAGAGSVAYAHVGDANDDGALDVLLSTNQGEQPDELALLLGDGLGGFGTPAHYVSEQVGRAFLADLDDDGSVDIAEPIAHGLRVLWGEGAGGFLAVQGVPTLAASGGYNKGSAVGDLNGDGFQDVVSSHYDATLSASVYLAHGPASFDPPSELVDAGLTYWAGLADFDADGVLDLATLIEAGGPEANNVALRLGDGAGGFGPRSLYGTGVFPNEAAIEDYDLDGRYDLATANFGSFQDSVSILANDGAGGFESAVNHDVPESANSIQFGELSGDALPDLLVGTGSGALTILTNQGDGSFAAGPTVAVPSDAQRVRLFDLNGDDELDLLLTLGSWVPNGKLEIWSGDGVGGFALEQTLWPGNKFAREATAADFSGDGRMDIVASSIGLSVFRGLPGGGYAQEERYASVGLGRSPFSTDLDHDGRLDLLVCDDSPAWATKNLGIHLNRLGDPAGVQAIGPGTWSCAGRQGVSASVVPAVGADDFALLTTNVPPAATGFLLVASSGSASGSDPAGLGLLLHADPLSPVFELYDAQSEANGSLRLPLPLPDNAALAGTSLALQTVWVEPLGPGCSSSWLPLSSSRGLALTIQP